MLTRKLFVIKTLLIPPLWQAFIGLRRGVDPLTVKAVLAFPSRSALLEQGQGMEPLNVQDGSGASLLTSPPRTRGRCRATHVQDDSNAGHTTGHGKDDSSASITTSPPWAKERRRATHRFLLLPVCRIHTNSLLLTALLTKAKGQRSPQPQ